MAIPIREIVSRMSRRERRILSGGAVILAGFALWGVLGSIQWYLDRMETLDRLIQKKHQDQISLFRLQKDYTSLKSRVDNLDRQIQQNQGGFSLLTYLESLAGRLGVRTKIAYMRPQPKLDVEGYQELGVELKIQGVTLSQTVDFLRAIEESKNLIHIKQLRLRTRYSEPQFIDAVFLATTYEQKRSES